MKSDYTVTIFWSGEDDCYIAVANELPGCSAHGETREDALREINVAMRLWVESAMAHGDTIPTPRPREVLACLDKAV